MKKKNYVCLKYKELINSLLINLVWMLAIILFCHPHFAGNDDLALNKIAAGCFGDDYSQYLVFNNIIYGMILKYLYKLLPFFNWYGIIPLILTFVCFIILLYLLQKKAGISLGCIVGITLLFLLSNDLYFKVQWTQNAGFYTAIGLFILFYDSSIRKQAWYLNIMAVILATMGIWIRKDAFLSVAGIIGISMLIDGIETQFWKVPVKILIRKYIYWLIIGFIFIISLIINNYVYQSDKEWKNYLEYNEYRSELLDYGVPDFKKYSSDYKDIGLDELDVKMFSSWNYADQNKFSLETLKKIKEIKDKEDKKKTKKYVLEKCIKNIINSMSRFNLVPLTFILFLWYVVFYQNKYRVLIPMLAVIAELMYLSYRGRFVYRVYFSIWLILFLIIILQISLNINLQKPTKRMGVFLLAGLFILHLPWGYELFINNTWEEKLKIQERNNLWVEELAKDNTCLYVGEPLETRYPYTSSIFTYFKPSANNLYLLGGWRCPSPITQSVLKTYGVDKEGIYESLIDNNKNIYYTESENTDYIISELEYIQKEYNKNINYELVDSIEKMDIFRFYQKQKLDFDDLIEENFLFAFDYLKIKKDKIEIAGWCYSPKIDPYKQTVWVRCLNQKTGNVMIKRATKVIRKDVKKVLGGKHTAATGFYCCFDKDKIGMGNCKVDIIVEDGNTKIYNQTCSEDISIKYQKNKSKK